MKKYNFKKIIGILILLATFTNCENEPVDLTPKADVIQKNSTLYRLISKVVQDGDNPTEHIVCLDFIYPFKVLIYDENLEIIGDKVLSGDDEFSIFLGELPDNQSISISYPITTTLEDGTVFSVNSNAELKIAIDSCSKEDIVNYCNSLFGGCDCPGTICVWKIPYIENGDNKYASGVFESNFDGTLHLLYNNISYTGTWTFLFVDDKLHININLEGDSQVAIDWNIDREIQLINEDIKILNSPKNIILRKSCQVTNPYQIGETGPSGGIVFYDKGSYSNGWRYMEAAQTDIGFFEWGCSGTSIENTSSALVGRGLFNSVQIANFHDNLINFYTNPSICNSANNGTVSAREALLYNTNEWFLPSENELNLMYQNLKIQNLGNFSDINYWSSTQSDSEKAMTIDFSDGTHIAKNKVSVPNNIKTRAVRYF